MSADNHAEAFCLMIYEDEVTGAREVLWNSRDGVTPFVITSRAGNLARHVEFGRDARVRNHTPRIGERVFVDLTLERARGKRRAYVAKWWDREIYGYRLADEFDSPDAAVERLASGDVGDGHQPDVIEVDEAFLAVLEQRRRPPLPPGGQLRRET